MTDFRYLLSIYVHAHETGNSVPPHIDSEARAALAEPVSDGPAVPDDREPAFVTTYPTDKELLELMPETMRDEFSYAAKVCSDATGGQVKPAESNYPAEPDGSLVKRVSDALMESVYDQRIMARAAILEITAWLRLHTDLVHGPQCALWIEQELKKTS